MTEDTTDPSWLEFEQLASIIMKAEPNKQIRSRHGNYRQFDGYKEIDESTGFTLKIGVEVKEYDGNVGSPDLEGFITKMDNCFIDKGIFVTNQGYSDPAISLAKDKGIELFTLKQADETDKGTEILVVNVYIQGVDYIANVNNLDITEVKPDDPENERRPYNFNLQFEGYEATLYDHNGDAIGNIIDMINREKEIFAGTSEYGEVEEKVVSKFFDEGVWIHHNEDGNRYKLQLKSFDILFQRIQFNQEISVGDKDLTHFYLLKNVTRNERRLIHQDFVRKLKTKYGIE